MGAYRDTHLFNKILQLKETFHLGSARKPTCFSGWEELPTFLLLKKIFDNNYNIYYPDITDNGVGWAIFTPKQ